MRSLRTSAVALAASFCAATAFAGQHGHSAPPPAFHGAPAPHPAPHRPPTTTTTHRPAPHTTATSHGAAPTHGASHGKTAQTAPHGSAARTRSGKHTTTAGGTGTSAAPTAATSSDTPTSPIAEKIQSHPQLASKLTALLPEGTTLQEAASGFRNQGQFIAALHVSQNLGIPFGDLKQQMVASNLSLGQAIQKLRPEANATRATRQAEQETDRDLATGATGAATGGTTTTTKHGRNHHR